MKGSQNIGLAQRLALVDHCLGRVEALWQAIEEREDAEFLDEVAHRHVGRREEQETS